MLGAHGGNNLIMLKKVLCQLLLLVHADIHQVETPLGKILGSWETSNGGRRYAAFEGIPFAKPPIGELRFEEPQPIEPWSEVLNATKTHTCIQSSFYNLGPEIQGEEDCLYLNVYVPATTDIDLQRNFDVLVHIHGGAFSTGSGHSEADAKILMDRDYIVVSMNYRLAALGFLSTEDAAVSGNNGMKDTVLALRWIKDNIASFGGNPNSVTITGVSAGAASVHLLYFSPLSEGLFSRGVSQSGTAIDSWAVKKNPLEYAKKLAALLDCPNTSTSELKQCLKEKPAALFIEKTKELTILGAPLSVPFAPVIEKGSANPFLIKDPYLLLEEENVLDVPWITSTTADEGLMMTGPYYAALETVDSNWSAMADYLLDYTDTVPASNREEVASKIKDFYLGSGEHINKDSFYKFTQIFTDRLFGTGGEVAAKLQSRANRSPVYYYFFNYKDGDYKVAQVYAGDENVQGVGHGEDAQYFYSSLFPPISSKSDVDLRNACQDMLYSYATTGRPSFDGTDTWRPTPDTALVYLNITGPGNIKLQATRNLTPVDFWRSIGL